MRNKEENQETQNKKTGGQQQKHLSIKHRSSDSMMKSKNIVERFVKLNEGGSLKRLVCLKPSATGSFKIQKSKKT